MTKIFYKIAFIWFRLAGGLLSHHTRSEFLFRHNNKNYVYCARCSGLYTTAVPGIIVFTILSSMGFLYEEYLTIFVGILIAPAVIDLVLLNYSSKWRESLHNKRTIAFSTGLLFGIGLAMFGPAQVEITSKVITILIVFAGLFLLYKTHLWIPYDKENSKEKYET